MMSRLALLTLVPACILLVLDAGLLVKPQIVREGIRRFPRDVWSGRVLSAVAVFWAAWILKDMPLGRFEHLKPGLLPAAVVLGGLVWYYMDELLAPRALGALLLLYPAPMLAAARLHPSPWSVFMSVVAYIMVVKGIALLLSPYLLRKVSERVLQSDTNCRAFGAIGALFALVMLASAFFVY